MSTRLLISVKEPATRRWRLRRARLVLALAVGFVCFSGQAAAYRTASDLDEFDEQRVAWRDPNVKFELSSGFLPDDLVLSEVAEAFEAAIAQWSSPECTIAAPVLSRTSDARAEGRDGKNTVAWITNWAQRGFNPSAAGTTDVQYLSEGDGWAIAEADIYLNAESFSWSIGGSDDARDVSAVLTHEIGHALGLLHQCELEPGDREVQKCETDSPYEGTTMYPVYDRGQSTLAPDDVAGICFLYSEAADCGDCSDDRICVDGQCMLPCPGALCGPGKVCGARGCVNEGTCTEIDCAGEPCESDAECGPVFACRGDFCSRGDRALGSKCTRNSDCSEGVCVVGTCEPECFVDGECGNSGDCVTADDGELRGCIESGLYAFGSECDRGEDCTSGICALTDERHMCTKRCLDDAQCGSGYECARVDGQDVCAPLVVMPAGGCSVPARLQPMGASGCLGFLSLVGLLGRQRQRLRRQR